MAEIRVRRGGVEKSKSSFSVTVRDEDGSESTHEVSLSEGDFDRWGGHYRSPEEFLRGCFEFLLEREPKESILPRFDVGVISRYFPEFEKVITRA
jgi:hypothetical protein